MRRGGGLSCFQAISLIFYSIKNGKIILASRTANVRIMFYLFSLCLLPVALVAHGVTSGDKGYIQEISGTNIISFMYLGAKHMVTGYDHLLFLFGVIFFLYRLKDVGVYVSLFAIGHSTTLLLGVFTRISVSPYLIDARSIGRI